MNLADVEQDIKQWESHVVAQKARRSDLDVRLENSQDFLKESTRQLADHEQARDVLVLAVAATQDQVRVFIEQTVTLALQSVFGEDYAFELTMRSKRGQSEMEPAILWQDRSFSPKGEVGGGVVDVVSFALRLVLWALSSNRLSPILLLDEPFKFLSVDKTEAAAEMLKGLSQQLGIQVIMASHNPGFAELADKAWKVRKNSNGVAEVTAILGGTADGGQRTKSE